MKKLVVLLVVVFASLAGRAKNEDKDLNAYKARLTEKVEASMGLEVEDVEFSTPKNPFHFLTKMAWEKLYKNIDFLTEAYIYTDKTTLSCIVFFDGNYASYYSHNIVIRHCSIWKTEDPVAW